MLERCDGGVQRRSTVQSGLGSSHRYFLDLKDNGGVSDSDLNVRLSPYRGCLEDRISLFKDGTNRPDGIALFGRAFAEPVDDSAISRPIPAGMIHRDWLIVGHPLHDKLGIRIL